jgi:hypothetical protein
MFALVVVACVSAQSATPPGITLRAQTLHARLLAQADTALTPPPPPPPSAEPAPQVEPPPPPPPVNVGPPMGEPPPPEYPPPRQYAPPTPSARLVDLDANSINGHEVLVGFLSGLGVHLVAGGAMTVGFIFLLGAAFGGSGGSGFAVAALIGLLAGLVIELFSPLLIAYFESLAADPHKPIAGSFGKSVGLGYAAFGLALVLDLLVQNLVLSSGSANPAAGALLGLVVAGLVLVGVPLGASFGRHWGEATAVDAMPAAELFPRTDPLFASLPKPIAGLSTGFSF